MKAEAMRVNLRRRPRTRTTLIAIFAIGFALSCTKGRDEELGLARAEVEGGRFSTALPYFERALAKTSTPADGIEVAREASRVAFFELKDYRKALLYFQYLVLNAEDARERLESQKQIVNIYFNHLADYKKAIVEIYKLTQMISDQSERVQYRIMLAKAYYYTNDFFQAESEVDEFLRIKLAPEYRYDLLLLKSNIATGRKENTRGAEILEKIITEFPERAAKENLGTTLAIAYEDTGQYDKAIEELEKLKKASNQPESYELRIKRLTDRKKNQPGRRGRRK